MASTTAIYSIGRTATVPGSGLISTATLHDTSWWCRCSAGSWRGATIHSIFWLSLPCKVASASSFGNLRQGGFYSETTRCRNFFDLEKAYDTTWKYGILKDLHDAGLRGRLPLFISGFLSDRKFQVRVSGTYSKVCEQEMGVPQGSILSVTLFCLKINSIVKALCPGVDCSLYVDDFLICYRSKYIHIIERHLQRCLNKLQEWADANGFKFSTSKTFLPLM